MESQYVLGVKKKGQNNKYIQINSHDCILIRLLPIVVVIFFRCFWMCLDLTELILGDGLSKARSMSDQPASCPLCGAILRQSRNLRRHLELLHFGFGSSNKSGVHMRHRRTDRNNDFVRSTLASICPPHITRTDYSRVVENTDLSTLTSLSIASTVNSNASNVSLAGECLAAWNREREEWLIQLLLVVDDTEYKN